MIIIIFNVTDITLLLMLYYELLCLMCMSTHFETFVFSCLRVCKYKYVYIHIYMLVTCVVIHGSCVQYTIYGHVISDTVYVYKVTQRN